MAVFSKDAPAVISGHHAHPNHKLQLVAAAVSGDTEQFRCDGCNEAGAGERYRCEPCNFDLHRDCALAEDTLEHPLLAKSRFELRRQAPAGRVCDACGSKVLGLHYRCAGTGLDLHPCCAKLPLEIKQGDLTLELRGEAFHRCNLCSGRGGVGTFWFYRSTTCQPAVYVHVRCVKELALAHRNRAAGGSSTGGAAGGSSTGGGAGDAFTASMIGHGDRVVMMPVAKEVKIKEHRGGRRERRLERVCTIVATVVRIIVCVIIGDPTALIAAVVVGLFSNSTG